MASFSILVKDIKNNKNLYQTFVRTIFWGSRLGTQTNMFIPLYSEKESVTDS